MNSVTLRLSLAAVQGKKRSCAAIWAGYKNRMPSTTFEYRIKLEQVFWFGLIGVAMILLGYLLPTRPLTLIMAAGALGWMITLPYHAKLSVYLAVTTFASALIV